MSDADNSDANDPIPFSHAVLRLRLSEYARSGRVLPSGSNPAIALRGERAACQHKSGTLDIDAAYRTVTCSACGQELSAFDALLCVARSERRLQSEYDYLVKEHADRRGFYASKDTVKAKTCRHTKRYTLRDGSQKCLRCEQVLHIAPTATDTQGKDTTQ